MTDCAKCGQRLGVGRYCTNCGHPVGDVGEVLDNPDHDWRTDTAERPRTPTAAPPTPPPAWTPPPAPRFPLYADEVDDPDHEVTATDHRRPRSMTGWVAAAVVLVLVILLGVWLLTSGDDKPPGAKRPTTSASATDGTDGPSPPATGGLTAESQVTVPETADSGQDVDGDPVTYDGANLLDGVPETCWRMPGDGSGEELVITLPRETRLRSVGMINGYAKKGGAVDWYHGNRRIDRVEWVFDDGTTVPQTLGETEAVQSVDVDVTTTTITLRLVAVSAPGEGSSRRDFTAISDLLLVAR
jgi:hypothetical protein